MDRTLAFVIVVLVCGAAVAGAAVAPQAAPPAALEVLELPDEVPRPEASGTARKAAAPRRRTCGTEDKRSTGARARVERAFAAQMAAAKAAPSVRTIDVYFWVVTYLGNGVRMGVVSKQRVDDQIAVLNDAFRPVGVQFVLRGSGLVNSTKAHFTATPDDTSLELETKASARQGGCNTLNVWTWSPADDTLGWSTFPWDCRGPLSNARRTLDGVVIAGGSLPGGDLAYYDLGATLVHETGHWLGLYHTFQGVEGCDPDNDFVQDTPAEGEPAFGCPLGRDTCPRNGPDPVTNYMDYSDDACMNSFTPGQAQRIAGMVNRYRM